jgi:hypothetical protein
MWVDATGSHGYGCRLGFSNPCPTHTCDAHSVSFLHQHTKVNCNHWCMDRCWLPHQDRCNQWHCSLPRTYGLQRFKGMGCHSQHALRRACLTISTLSLTWVTRPPPHQGQLMNSISQVNHSVAPFLGPRTTFFRSSVMTLPHISRLTTPQIAWSSSVQAALTMTNL